MVYVDLPPDQLAATLQQTGLSPTAAMVAVAGGAAAAAGALYTDSDDLDVLLGRAPTPMADTVRDAARG